MTSLRDQAEVLLADPTLADPRITEFCMEVVRHAERSERMERLVRALAPSALIEHRATIELVRPLASIDAETTGLDVRTDRFVAFGIVRVEPNGETSSRQWRMNPGIEVSLEASCVHGITNASVMTAPSFAEQAHEIADALKGCDLVGFNLLGFDIPILRREFDDASVPWPCAGANIVDVSQMFRKIFPRTLQAAARLYGAEVPVGSHDAVDDASMTLSALSGMVSVHDLPRSIAALADVFGGYA